MEILTPEQLQEWARIDPDMDTLTLAMLEGSAIDVVEHHTGRKLRPYLDANGTAIMPEVPTSLKHAVAVLVSAHYDQWDGADEATMTAVRRLCAPFRVPHL